MRQAAPTAGQPRTLVGRLVDALLDLTALSLALWTLLYCLALPTQWSLWPSGWIWLVGTVVIGVLRVRGALRPTADVGPATEAGPSAEPPAGTGAPPRRDLLLLGGLVLVALAGVGGLVWTPGTFNPTWAALVLGTAVLIVWAWLAGRVRPEPARSDVAGDVPAVAPSDEPSDGPTGWRRFVTPSELGVLAVAGAITLLTAFVHLADTDDPYYVNRSVWVAERGNAALLDTMFSPEQLNSPYGGGVPIASIEALFGVVAHMSGLLAGTVTYLLAGPAFAALAVLALWRLARRWAPRRAFLVFAGAVLFLLMSGDSMLGNFWIVRIWQGKVIAVAVLMPLLWAWLTDAHEARTPAARRSAVLLLLAGGIAFFGLTPTAVVWAPLMLAVALVAAAALRSPWLALGGVALAVGPVLSGLAVIRFSVEEVGGTDPVALPARESFVRILGETTPMVALALLALGLAVVLARRGAPAALAGASALGSVLVFAPGVLELANTVTGSGPILWRMLYVAPIPVLVGLLLAAPVPALGPARAQVARAVPVAVGVLAVALLALGARPIWAYTGHGGPVTLRASPQWKLDTEALRDVRVLADQGIRGTVLLPPRRMKVLTMYTTDAFPVVPREWFIQNMREPREVNRGRRVLYQLASGETPLPPRKESVAALEALDVTLACVGPSKGEKKVLRTYRAAGLTRQSSAGTLTCLQPPA